MRATWLLNGAFEFLRFENTEQGIIIKIQPKGSLLMQELVCPSCGKEFKIDGAGYAEILKQVRNSEFDSDLRERLKIAESEKSHPEGS